MRYVFVSIMLGLIWAAMQFFGDRITEPRALIGPVLVFALFGVAMWGIKGALLWLRQRRQGGSR